MQHDITKRCLRHCCNNYEGPVEPSPEARRSPIIDNKHTSEKLARNISTVRSLFLSNDVYGILTKTENSSYQNTLHSSIVFTYVKMCKNDTVKLRVLSRSHTETIGIYKRNTKRHRDDVLSTCYEHTL